MVQLLGMYAPEISRVEARQLERRLELARLGREGGCLDGGSGARLLGRLGAALVTRSKAWQRRESAERSIA